MRHGDGCICQRCTYLNRMASRAAGHSDSQPKIYQQERVAPRPSEPSPVEVKPARPRAVAPRPRRRKPKVKSEPRRRPARSTVTVDEVIEATAKVTSRSVDEVRGVDGRGRNPVVEARNLAMFVARQVTEQSYPALGRAFSGRHHTTVMHAVERVGERLHSDSAMADQVQQIVKAVTIRKVRA